MVIRRMAPGVKGLTAAVTGVSSGTPFVPRHPVTLPTFALSWYLLAGPAAQAKGCDLLKPADLTPLLGATITPKAAGASCSWNGGGKKVLALVYKTAGGMMYDHAREASAKENKSTADQSGIGDKAFTSIESFGAVIVMLKQGRVLQLQYHTGGAATQEDVEALKALAKKAVAAF